MWFFVKFLLGAIVFWTIMFLCFPGMGKRR